MKLVNILARELRAWPEQYDCLSQMRHDGVILARLELAEDSFPAGVIVTKAQWQAAVDALKNCAHLWVGWSDTEACELCNKTRKIVVEWNGEGLPPVGTVCEIEQSGEWNRVEVMYLSNCTLLLKFDVDEENDNEGAYDPRDPDIKLRPIRTPEQIAADEREGAIHQMVDNLKRWNDVQDLCGMRLRRGLPQIRNIG